MIILDLSFGAEQPVDLLYYQVQTTRPHPNESPWSRANSLDSSEGNCWTDSTCATAHVIIIQKIVGSLGFKRQKECSFLF